MLDAKGEIVGLAFDGNIHSISGSYWFDERMNRSIGVHPAYIRTALEKVYDGEEPARRNRREVGPFNRSARCLAAAGAFFCPVAAYSCATVTLTISPLKSVAPSL
jgi:hypothetical protein